MAKIKTNVKSNAEKIVIDTSVIIEGLASIKIESGDIKPKEILIHEAVLSELENQANSGKEIGYIGLAEVKKLRAISKKYKFKITYTGKRPEEFQIKRAKSGEIDALIRALAFQEKATLLTADKVQALVAEAKGVDTVLIEFEFPERKFVLESFFDKTTMSVHIKENTKTVAKKGMPGDWEFAVVGKKESTKDEIEDMVKDIVEEATRRPDGFIEIERRGSTIIQLSNYRIVITKPPFADGWEITAVRPVKRLSLDDYKLSDKLKERIAEQADGILIAGSPGMGKTTFAQGLAEYYSTKDNIVKTIEAPRDLILPDEVTQYSISHGSQQEIHDILLLTRPDYTLFDEMRNTDDFRLFSDLRLAGVGMVGVIHATNPIDAIQRFIGRIELGVIPHVIDTVVFIKDGGVNKVLNVQMQVKVPSGMSEADLARPIVIVSDFETGKAEFEIYSYGEQTVVIPVEAEKGSPAKELAKITIANELQRYSDFVEVDMVSEYKCIVYVPDKDIAGIIGREGKRIQEIESNLGISIDVRELKELPKNGTKIDFSPEFSNKFLIIRVDPKYSEQNVDVYIKDDYFASMNAGKNGEIRVKKTNKLGKALANSLKYNEKIEIFI
ncbi:PINc/VapC family ATPase [Nanoarchaeota archaeon]